MVFCVYCRAVGLLAYFWAEQCCFTEHNSLVSYFLSLLHNFETYLCCWLPRVQWEESPLVEKALLAGFVCLNFTTCTCTTSATKAVVTICLTWLCMVLDYITNVPIQAPVCTSVPLLVVKVDAFRSPLKKEGCEVANTWVEKGGRQFFWLSACWEILCWLLNGFSDLRYLSPQVFKQQHVRTHFLDFWEIRK